MNGYRRRDLLRFAAATPAGLFLLGCGQEGTALPDATMGIDPDAGIDAGPSDPDAALCRATTSDVLGPFHEAGAPMRAQIADVDEPGERLGLVGKVLEADCVTPIAGVLLDLWQADRDGNYHAAGQEYRLRGKVQTDAAGEFRVDTIRPGSYELGPGSMRPAHIHVIASGPGFVPVTTQLYFENDPFLPPNDGCTGCGSDDPDRILSLQGGPETGWTAEVQLILARA